jgi:hypothetical protein
LSRLGFTSIRECGDPTAAWLANGASCAALAARSRQMEGEHSNGNAFTAIALRNPWHQHRTAATAITFDRATSDCANCGVPLESAEGDRNQIGNAIGTTARASTI